jgi:hypothetical protein
MADENLVDQVVDTKTVPPATDQGDDQGSVPSKSSAAGPVETPVDAPADTTLVDAPDTKAADRPTPVDWPADWREKAAAGDAKKLARLGRYASPTALADALIAAQNRISSGDLKVSLGKDAKPEEIAAYREAHGIPEAPDKYDLGGFEVQELDKPIVDTFLAAAHGANMTPAQVQASLAAHAEGVEKAKQAQLAKDNDIKTQAEDKLRGEWGPEYRTNINLITNLLDTAPQGVRDKLLHGRLSDGTPIGSSVEALQFLVGLARERNPAGVVVPSGVATSQSVQDEKSKIEEVMRKDRRAYDRDDKMQARYRQLIEWEMAQKGQRAA